MRLTLYAGILAAIVLAGKPAAAQTWETGIFAGGAGYMGDLNTTRPYKLTNFAFGAQFKRNFNGYWSVKLNIVHGTIGANDRYSPGAQNRLRNLSFFSPVTEGGIHVEYNFFNYIPTISKKPFTPYLFTGAGAVRFNPKTRYNNDVYVLNSYHTEGQDRAYKTIALSIPVGAGLKYNFSGKWSLTGEIGYRTAYSDDLDDVSGRYPDPNTLKDATAIALSDRSGELTGVYLGAPGTQRGDFRRRDSYLFTGFGLTYTFISSKCPVVER
jgi:hypothetical protein